VTPDDFRLLVAVVVGVPTWWFTNSVLAERWPRPLFGMIYWQISAAVLVAFVVAGLVLALTGPVFGW
jgi:hypothetical protein